MEAWRSFLPRALAGIHAVADADVVTFERAAEGRMAGGGERAIETEIDAGAREVRAEGIGGFERRETRVAVRTYANLISYITAAPMPRAI